MKNTSRQITEGVIWKQLLLFFFPIVMGSFFQQMYNTVDTVIVGRFVGTHALAAVGASSPIINLVGNFFIGVSSGATVILSQSYGAGDRRGSSEAMHTGIALAVVMGLVVTALGLCFSPQLLRFIGTPDTCIDDAVVYCRIYFSGSLASMLYNMGAGILRAMGDSKKPMFFLIAACVTNIVLDLLFVVGFDMGIAGVGIATVLSQIISAVLVLAVLLWQKDGEKLEVKKLRFHPALLGRILAIGIPAGLQYVMFDLSNLIVQAGINSFGDATIAAWTAYGKSDAITWMISGAFGVAVTTFVGQNFGAQKYDRVRKSVRVAMVMSIGIVGTLSVLLLVFRSFILGIYTTDQEVIRIGGEMMVQIVLFNALFMPIEVFAGAMRGTGYALPPTLIMVVCVCLVRVVWILTMVPRFHTLHMLTVVYPLSWGIASAVFLIVYLRGDWLKKRIEALGLEPER